MQKERAVHMNGNQQMGGAAAWEEIEMGAIPSSTAALSEVIYVGRASFRVALEVEAPSPAVDATAWFRSVEDDRDQRVILSAGPGWPAAAGEPNDRGDTASDTDGIPILYDAELLRPIPRRARASRWTLGLPLAFGGLFCGILTSPLLAPARPRHKKETPPAAVSTIVASVAPVAPIVAPISVSEPTAPPVTMLTETFANRFTMVGTKPVLQVQGRASTAEKSGLHKAAPRRPARIASSDGGSHARPAAAEAATSRPWVDPWADN
jgi:hypothetical protein